MTAPILLQRPEVRNLVEEMLREGASDRAIARVAGVSYMTVARYSRSNLRERPRSIAEPTPELIAARQRLDRAFDRFENGPCRVNHDAWARAQREYESLRAAMHSN